MATTTTPIEKSRPDFILTIARFREVSILLFIVVLVIAVSLRAPSFLTLQNGRDILLNISILSIVALAQAMIIITRGIDLSVSSMVGLVAMMVAFTIRAYPSTPMPLLVLLGITIGSILGAFNGLIIAYGKVPPIIATLGTLSVYRGLIFFYSNGTWINAHEMPATFKLLTKASPLGLPNLVIFAIVVAILAYLFLNFTRPGRDIYALGSNPDAARVSGIRTLRITFMVYMIAGLACGLAGVLWASRYEAAQTNTALGFELQTVAASVVGGVNLLGGSGSVIGVLLGSLLLGIIQNALTLVRISPFWELAAQGLLILLAVIVDSTIQRRLRQATIRGGKR